ncbi:MAG: glutathione S-transferase family protein [Hyphomicrobiaceae bacterium]
MIQFYYNGAPNPMKVALFLEESGLEYEPIPLDTRAGDQHEPEFKSLNPNAKAPTIVDGETIVFDSNAILLYLAEKTGKFLPSQDRDRGELLSWLMFVATGIGPYSGQCVHFRHVAPQPKDYALNRYDFEADRHFKIVDDRLSRNHYMLGDEYTIVDMALWGWARMVPYILGDNAMADYANLKRFMDEINARPAAGRAEALKSRHAFKTEMDAEAHRAMFPQNERLAS